MSDEDNAWLREQAAAIVDAELRRVQTLIEQLYSSFTGGSAQQYAKYVSAAESETALLRARVENGITICVLEHHAARPKENGSPARWDVFISHASKDNPTWMYLSRSSPKPESGCGSIGRQLVGGATFASLSITA